MPFSEALVKLPHIAIRQRHWTSFTGVYLIYSFTVPNLLLTHTRMLSHIAIRQHWTSFTGTKVLASWYKSTNTDISAAAHNQRQENGRTRTQFTSFTSTKVQILTQKALLQQLCVTCGFCARKWLNTACTTSYTSSRLASTKVQILAQLLVQKYKY